MLPILALDTCLGAVSAALLWRDAQGVDRSLGAWELCRGGHAERLIPMVQTLLADAAVEAREVGCIAVTLGPGTFTGVRTGIAAARAFALSCGAAVVGVSSLHAMAVGLAQQPVVPPEAADIAIIVDARKGQVFAQLFDAAGGPRTEPALLTMGEAAALLVGGRWRIGGSSAATIASAAQTQGATVVSLHASLEPDATTLLRLARSLAPLASVMPIYLRAPDALPPSGKGLARVAS